MFGSCCCCTRTAFDDFNRTGNDDPSVGSTVGWTEVAGDWDIGSGIFGGNQLTISTNNAILLATQELTNLDSFLVTLVNNDVSNTSIFRICIDYVDSDNYLAVEFERDTAVRFIARTAGVETTEWWGPNGAPNVGTCQYHVGRIDGYLWGMAVPVPISGTWRGTAYARSITSGKVALMTKSVSGRLDLDDYENWSGVCSSLIIRCNSCSADTSLGDPAYFPDEIEATLTGAVNGTCGSCTSYNATYVLKFVGSNHEGWCTWRYYFTSALCSTYAYLELTADRTGATSAHDFRMRLHSSALNSSTSPYVQWDGGSPRVGCAVPSTTLSYTSSTGAAGVCSFSGSSWSIQE